MRPLRRPSIRPIADYPWSQRRFSALRFPGSFVKTRLKKIDLLKKAPEQYILELAFAT
jgi:hypothetical protein